MLKQLLALIGDNSLYTQHDLAEALSVPVPLVAQMLEQLAQTGYLAESQPCASSCGGCLLERACSARPGMRVWTLTAKGMACRAIGL